MPHWTITNFDKYTNKNVESERARGWAMRSEVANQHKVTGKKQEKVRPILG